MCRREGETDAAGAVTRHDWQRHANAAAGV